MYGLSFYSKQTAAFTSWRPPVVEVVLIGGFVGVKSSQLSAVFEGQTDVGKQQRRPQAAASELIN